MISRAPSWLAPSFGMLNGVSCSMDARRLSSISGSMTSRDSRAILWEQLFAVNSRAKLPLQAQLRSCIVQAILDGLLEAGAALPSSRHLAGLLQISRNTVIAAYQQLVDEAFIESRSRSGFFVRPGLRRGCKYLPGTLPPGRSIWRRYSTRWSVRPGP